MEHVVRMGEVAVTNVSGDTLACIGLGSCIGLLLIDRLRSVAALAHVMLPSADGSTPEQLGKYADTAVPHVVELVRAHGAVRPEAALVGGAAMFAFGGAGGDIGARNEAAVRDGLQLLRIPVVNAVTGGGRGRTLRVVVNGTIEAVVREAGGADTPLNLS